MNSLGVEKDVDERTISYRNREGLTNVKLFKCTLGE